jgi:hypothetical protein
MLNTTYCRKKNRANWTEGQTTFLVYMMKEYADAGKFRGQNGWTGGAVLMM